MPRIHFLLFTNSPLCVVFSGNVVDEAVNATHGSFPVMTGSSILIYFQNLNRLRSNCGNFERFRYECLVGNKFSEFIT
jgi:hypothetical protein